MSIIVSFLRFILRLDHRGDENHSEVSHSTPLASSYAEWKFENARDRIGYSSSGYRLWQSNTLTEAGRCSSTIESHKPSRSSIKKPESLSKPVATTNAAGQTAFCSSYAESKLHNSRDTRVYNPSRYLIGQSTEARRSSSTIESEMPSRASVKKPESLSKPVATKNAAGQTNSSSSYAEPKLHNARDTRVYSPSGYPICQSTETRRSSSTIESETRSRASVKKPEFSSKPVATKNAPGQTTSCSSYAESKLHDAGDTRVYSPSGYLTCQSTGTRPISYMKESERPSRASLKKSESSSKPVVTTYAARQSTSCSSSSPEGTVPSKVTAEPPLSSNPTLRLISGHGRNQPVYVLDANSSLPLYLIPKDVEDLIKQDNVPQILRKPLSPLTYKPYFAALLYAEDFYYKKFSNYQLENVSLELQQIEVHKRTDKRTQFNGRREKVRKTFAAFEMNSVPENWPFLLSRDLVHARLSDTKLKPFQGFVYRVAKGSILLVDFGEDFYSWHHENNKYDISFTFNRVCLKRAHQAIQDASDSLLHNFLFPEPISRKRHPSIQVTHSSHQQLDLIQKNAVHQISLLHSSPPYLIEGPPCVLNNGWPCVLNNGWKISRTGAVVERAVFQIHSTSPNSKILICASTNSTCDELMSSMKKKRLIPESDMFRATAAFRELGDVPDDIFTLCDYDKDKECFTCPSLDELCKYKIIFSTFMSSFRLHARGLAAGHFSHVFLLDASAAIEPVVLVPLTKFATDTTAVVVTGQTGNQPMWVRSTLARGHGLKISFFQRLKEQRPYRNLDPSFILRVGEEHTGSEESFAAAY